MTAETYDGDVVWNGTLSRQGLSLLPDRETKNTGIWIKPNRLYNRTGLHRKQQAENILDNLEADLDNNLTLEASVLLEEPHGE